MPSGGHNSKFGGRPTSPIRLPNEYVQFLSDAAQWLSDKSVRLSGYQTIEISLLNGRIMSFSVKSKERV